VDHMVHGKNFRIRKPSAVYSEIKALIATYGIKEIDFMDDNFTLVEERVRQICDLIKEFGLTWRCSGGVRVDTLSFPLLKKMKEAGCYMLSLGIESGNQEILKNIKKQLSLEQVKKVVSDCRKLKIETRGLFMLGNLGENESTMRQTIEFACRLPLDTATFHVTVPFTQTEYWEIIRKEGQISDDWADYNSYANPIFKHKDLTPELMTRMQKLAYRKFYFRIHKIPTILKYL
jgi:radical SAM superfamily enzyme YgiQ (UPF0313 family)